MAKILGIESASLTASVAIAEGDILLAEYTVNYKKTHSQTLLPYPAAPVPLPGCGSAAPRRRGWDRHWENRWWPFLPWMRWLIIFSVPAVWSAR